MTSIRPVGPGALLVQCGDEADVAAWRAELGRRREAGQLVAVDIVPGAHTVLVDGVADPAETARHIAGWAPPPPVTAAEGGVVEIPTVYDGADLAAVADLLGVAPADVVAALAAADLRVAFCGFAPGFGYLTGLPPGWSFPRLATPRPRVPAGSVGLAGHYAGIYPGESPGGWRLVGRTTVRLFDVHRDPPALLAPGVRVRLTPVADGHPS